MLAERHRLRPESRSDDVVAIADAMVALHSSDPATVFLSVFARMIDASSAAVEQALYAHRTLLRHHAMRRTLWVATVPMAVAMNASSTRKIAAGERKKLIKALAATSGIDDPQRALEHFESELIALIQTDGPLTTREIGIRKPELARKVTVGSEKHSQAVGAHTRLTGLAGFEASLIRGKPKGTWVASEYNWNLTCDWTSTDFDSIDERAGAATVLRAWLARFGPGTEIDLRWWTGWTAAAVRRSLADIGAIEVSLEHGQNGWVLADDPLLDREPQINDEPWIAVLPGLDPTTMGWKERGWYLDDSVTARVFDRNGNAGPTIWRNGQVVGGWVQRPSGDLAIELVHRLDAVELALLDTELERLRAAIGEIRFRVRFPSPNQATLLS